MLQESHRTPPEQIIVSLTTFARPEFMRCHPLRLTFSQKRCFDELVKYALASSSNALNRVFAFLPHLVLSKLLTAVHQSLLSYFCLWQLWALNWRNLQFASHRSKASSVERLQAKVGVTTYALLYIQLSSVWGSFSPLSPLAKDAKRRGSFGKA